MNAIKQNEDNSASIYLHVSCYFLNKNSRLRKIKKFENIF